MTKPTLFYTLKRNWYAGGFEIMRVTSERKRWTDNAPTHYYGSQDSGPTHCRADQCTGRFDTEQEARAVVDRVKRVREQHAANHAYLTHARNLAEKAEREAIAAVVAGLDPEVPPNPADLLRDAVRKGPDQCRRLASYGN
jgi:hypothetical protein